MAEEHASESKSSIKVTLNSKGEAQIEIKTYEGEVNASLDRPVGPGEVIPMPTVTGEELAAVTAQRLMATIDSLERQRIKVVGRELPASDEPHEPDGNERAMAEVSGPDEHFESDASVRPVG